MVKLEWYYRRPKDYYPRCIEMFGQPNAMSSKKGGFAYWKTQGLFDEHLLRDEDVLHCVPREHHDYFYSSVKFFVPKEKVMDVLSITGSIQYDGLKKLLTARCGGIGANYATLYLGMKVANGQLSIKEVKKGDMYPNLISQKDKSHDELKKEMIKMKKSNHKKYHKQLKLHYATYAFDKCYKPETKKQLKERVKKLTRKVGKGLKNSRNESCSKNNSTSCCPHMKPDKNGKYAATTAKHEIKINNKKYYLHTCCKMCYESMQELANKNPAEFDKKYLDSELPDGNLILKNRFTEKPVQIVKKI